MLSHFALLLQIPLLDARASLIEKNPLLKCFPRFPYEADAFLALHYGFLQLKQLSAESFKGTNDRLCACGGMVANVKVFMKLWQLKNVRFN